MRASPGWMRTSRGWMRGTALLGVAFLHACGGGEGAPRPPSAGEIEALYTFAGDLQVEMRGNVAQITVEIDREEFRRGGALWARATPYIFLFSTATRDAFDAHPGLGGVRVVVRYEDGGMVAQALLDRPALNSGAWTRALNVAALARTQGTQSPGYMRDLVRWGEDHTDFEYNTDYIPANP